MLELDISGQDRCGCPAAPRRMRLHLERPTSYPNPSKERYLPWSAGQPLVPHMKPGSVVRSLLGAADTRRSEQPGHHNLGTGPTQHALRPRGHRHQHDRLCGLERRGSSLRDALPLSIARFSSPVPDPFWRETLFRRHFIALPLRLILSLLILTTIAIQFSSTLLFTDVDTGSVVGYRHRTSNATGYSFQAGDYGPKQQSANGTGDAYTWTAGFEVPRVQDDIPELITQRYGVGYTYVETLPRLDL